MSSDTTCDTACDVAYPTSVHVDAQVELVCSPVNVVLYLFKLMKYIHKGADVNRLQLVANGETQRGAQGSADSSTASPRRAQGRDSSK